MPKWFVEGDIKGCFDNIDHMMLIAIISRKIKDVRFVNLIRLFLKAGYMEDWKYYGTYSGCPQGGILSPILANIYLNELDKFVETLKKSFDSNTPYTLRTMNNTVELLIPLKDKVEKYLFNKGAVKQRADNGKLEPVARVDLTRNTDLEIVTTYDAEIRGLCNFYFLASNYRSLNYFSYLMEYSCLKTLAWKHRCKLSKIYDKYRIGAKRWGIP